MNMIIYIYIHINAYLLYNINQAYVIIPEKSKAGGKRRINCPLPLHFIARSFINPGRELVSRYFTMGAGALVNPRFFDERARSEQLRFSKTPKRSRDHGTGHRQLPAARRLNKGWTLPLPAVSRAWSRVQLAFTLERLPRPTGLSGESRHRYLVSVPFRARGNIRRFREGVGQTDSNVMLMRGDRSWEQHPNDTPSEYLPSSSSNYKLGSIAGTRSKPIRAIGRS